MTLRLAVGAASDVGRERARFDEERPPRDRAVAAEVDRITALTVDVLGRSGDRFVYVGDNPAKDFVAPNAMGWTTIMIRRPGARLIHANAETAAGGAAQHVVASLEDLDRVIGM